MIKLNALKRNQISKTLLFALIAQFISIHSVYAMAGHQCSLLFQKSVITESGLSTADVRVIEKYNRGYMNQFFTALRSGMKLTDPSCLNCINLLAAINKLPTTTSLVYRGVKTMSADVREQYLVKGNIIVDLGFVSASKDSERARSALDANSQDGLMLIIKSKSGKDIEGVLNEIDLTAYQPEVLFAPGVRMRVVDVTYDTQTRIPIVTLEEI